MVATLSAPPKPLIQPKRQPRQREKLAVIDCDIHATMPNDATLYKYLAPRWRRHHEQFGMRGHIGGAYPRAVPNAARVDSWPPSGLPAGGDLPFMQEQLLDEWDLEYGVLTPLFGAGGQVNLEFGAALASAVNDWQIAEWVEQDSRLRGSILVAYEDGELAAQEIDRVGDHPGFVQVLMVVRTREPLGHRKYWKMYEAACRHDIPIAIHFGGAGGGPPQPDGRAQPGRREGQAGQMVAGPGIQDIDPAHAVRRIPLGRHRRPRPGRLLRRGQAACPGATGGQLPFRPP